MAHTMINKAVFCFNEHIRINDLKKYLKVGLELDNINEFTCFE